MWGMLVGASWLVISGAVWQVNLQDGTTFQGELRQWNRTEAEFQVGTETRKMSLTALQTLTPVPPPAAPPNVPTTRLTLHDGSVLVAQALTMAEGQARWSATAGGNSQTLPGRQVRALQFSTLREQQVASWQELFNAARDTDAVVVIKATGALDYAAGIVQGITDKAVQFEFGGKVVELPRERLAGVLFARPANAQAGQSPMVVEFASGEQWQLAELTADSANLQGKTVSGVELQGSWSNVARVVLQLGKFEYLSQLEPLEQSWQPFLAANSFEAADLLRLFQPHRDRSFIDDSLVVCTAREPVQWQVFDKGLAMHSRSEVAYRLGRKYRRFSALVGVDPRQPRPGQVELKIFADDALVFSEMLDGEGVARSLDLDVANANRLRIVVDYGEGRDTGDQLNLCDAKLWE